MNSVPLLATKLYIPNPRPALLRRPRLTERLNRTLCVAPSVGLLSAPAGFGKTTLLSEWISQIQCPAAWMSLDPRDNDVERFLAYVMAALRTISIDLQPLDDVRLRLPSDESAKDEWIESVMTTLINEIAAMTQQLILVLDDYHVIESPAVHTAVAYLIDNLPPLLHVIIANRADPPLPLARLRARGQLTEIREGDLRCTLDEAAAFLNQVMGLQLPAEDIATLETRTEGWIAGLQLAALSMSNESDVAHFVKTFAGVDRYVADYLTEEVFLRQPHPIQSFLLQTSILDRLCGPVCDAVTGQANSQSILEDLERANLFIVPLDNERYWYRYHHLFADFLKARLRRAEPDQWSELNRRAALWCEQAGLMEDAVQHALEAKDFELATRFNEQVAERLWSRSEITTQLNWLEALPRELILSQPRLCLRYASALANSGHLDAVEPLLQAAEMHLLKAESTQPESPMTGATHANGIAWQNTVPGLLAKVDIFRAYLARFHNASDAITFSQRALCRIPDHDVGMRARALLFLGHAHLLRNDTETAHHILAEAIDASRAVNHVAVYLSATNYLVQVHVLQGQLRQAAAICREALQYVADQKEPMFAGIEQILMGDLLREWNDLESASRYIEEGLRLAELGGDFVFVRDSYIARARLEQAKGNLDAALKFIHQADKIAQRTKTRHDHVLVEAWQVRLWLAQGNLAAAEHWTQTHDLESDEPLNFLNEFAGLAWARVLIARNQASKAEQLLERLHISAEVGKRTGRVIEILILQALVAYVRQDVASALARLNQALILAEPEGYLRTFVDEGVSMAALLQWAAMNRTDMSGYIGKLLAAFDLETRSKASQLDQMLPGGPGSFSLSATLSDRELEVLRLLASGRSARQIAQELFVSIGTVQTHMKSIYRKLDVHSSLQAVERGRALRLV